MGSGAKAQFQCMNCGALYWIEDPPNINEDELYTKIRCKCCKQETNHLWVGERPEDLYIYYDLNKDPRFYNYNTK
jgi:DNA-directed RNA polymerase subunit RPC12/RpoP